MVYTGKLPLGKHNVSRIIAAADNLQMFDVAVSFKNVLTNIISQQPLASPPSTQTPTLTPVNKSHGPNPDVSVASPRNDESAEDGTRGKENSEEDTNEMAKEEPARKRVCPELSESPGQFLNACQILFFFFNFMMMIIIKISIERRKTLHDSHLSKQNGILVTIYIYFRPQRPKKTKPQMLSRKKTMEPPPK